MKKGLMMFALASVMMMGLTLWGAESPKIKPKKPIEQKDRMPELSSENIKKIEDALPAKATAKPRKERSILVFWRCEGFFHGAGIAGGAKAIELMGKKTGAYSADISRDYESLEPANLEKYDAVVFLNTTGLIIPEASRKGLLNFVNNGKGIIGIHAATDNFYDWPEGAVMMGGLFSGHPWKAGGTWAFKLDEPDHPLVKAFGGKGFKLQDEIYQFKDPYTRADRCVLISLDLADPATGAVKGARADNDYAVAWIKNTGRGRVFYGSLGHAANVFQDPAVLKFYLDGIQFALADLDVDATPKRRK